MPHLEEQNVTICIFKSLCNHQSFQQKSLDDHSCSAAVSIKRSETSLDVELLLQWRPFLQRDGQRPFSVFFADQLKVTVGHFDVTKIDPIAYKDIQYLSFCKIGQVDIQILSHRLTFSLNLSLISAQQSHNAQCI